jgi:hypothetical protein
MMRGRLARAALRCYPPATRTARGAEMLDTLLEASDDRRGVFVWNSVSLVAAGLGERARASARLSAGRTIAEAAKLASILYACLWLTASAAVLIEGPGWRHDSRVLFCMVGLLIVLFAWSRGRQRLAGVIGFACTVAVALVAAHRPDLLLAHRPDLLLPVSIVPACGYLIMAIAPTRERPSALAVGVLAGLVVVSVIVGANTSGFGQFIVLTGASIAGLAVFAVQPRLAIAVAIIWTAIGTELTAFASTQPAPSKLLVATAPAVFAVTVARARLIRRRAI